MPVDMSSGSRVAAACSTSARCVSSPDDSFRKRRREKLDADAIAMRLDLAVLRLGQLQPFKHRELVHVAGLACLIASRGRAAHHQVSGAEGLEFDCVGVRCACRIAQRKRERHVAVVIDAGLRDDEDGRA
jgi:hypothetical protein